jgi:hypothetical protein
MPFPIPGSRFPIPYSLLFCVASCTVASSDPGYDAFLQVDGAQFRPGAFPDASGGPETLAAATTHSTVEIGRVRERMKSTLDGGATAAIVGIAGEEGAWIVRAGPPDVDAPGLPTATAQLGFADVTPPGPFKLLVAAVDAEGRIGPARVVELVAAPVLPPEGDLVVSLAWTGKADLDLHVIDPLGHEVWSGSPNTWQPPPPGEPVDPDAWLTGGILDHDGNAGCHRDGAPDENVVWTTRTGSSGPVAPLIPTGDYVVRVDTRSMCGDPAAAWSVTAYDHGAPLASARGSSVADDVLHPHGAGAGATALHFSR